MERLEHHELNCLRALAAHSANGAQLCSTPILTRLLALGLISASPQLQLPLLWSRVTFSVTERGKAYLQQS